MRAIIDAEFYGPYAFITHMDTGWDENCILVRVWGMDARGRLTVVGGRDFNPKANPRHRVNFCKKFANDEDYRKKYLWIKKDIADAE